MDIEKIIKKLNNEKGEVNEVPYLIKICKYTKNINLYIKSKLGYYYLKAIEIDKRGVKTNEKKVKEIVRCESNFLKSHNLRNYVEINVEATKELLKNEPLN